MERLAEHFNSVVNWPSSINEDAINGLPQKDVLLDEFPTVLKQEKAIQQLPSGKAPGADTINAEVYKAGAIHARETERLDSLYIEEGGYPTRI